MRLCCVLLLVSFAAPSVAAGENWPSFQNGGRVSSEKAEIADKFSLAWSADIPGYGQSSPVVWNGQISVTSVSGDNKETYHVSGYRLSDGEKRWQHDVQNASPQESTNYVSKAAPTPVADENGVICFFEGGNLLALTHEGELRWERNLVEEYGPIDARHGLGASVEQADDVAFVWVERQTEPYVLAVDKQTGETRWKVAGLGVTSWASPRLVPVPGGEQLVLSGIGRLAGLEPATGQRLWTFDGISGNSTPTPIPLGEGRFLIGATEGRGEESDASRAAESNGVISIEQQDDGSWQAGFAWQAKRATSSFGSPIAHAGDAYFVNRSGVLFCLDAATGEERYAQRLGNSIWATPIARADRVVFFGKDGLIKTTRAGERFQAVSEINLFQLAGPDSGEPVADATLYAATVVGGRLLIRSGNSLHCLRP